MKNKKLIRFVESFILLPFITTSLPVGNLTTESAGIVEANINSPQTILLEKLNSGNILVAERVANQEEETLKVQAEAIDAYFEDRDMPLSGLGKKMAEEATKNDLDWRLVAAIAVRESTGGKFDCKKVDNNPFGWGSCKIGFKSNEEAIETVARNLGGNNPKTAYHYDDKTTMQILRAYNPPTIVRHYAEQVISIMNAIGPENVTAPMNMEKTTT